MWNQSIDLLPLLVFDLGRTIQELDIAADVVQQNIAAMLF